MTIILTQDNIKEFDIMIVGMAYDLQSDYLKEGFSPEETAEFDKEETIAALEEAISQAGYQPVRIGNAKALMQALLRGERWDLVFNIAEGLYGDGRESLVPALLDMYKIPYVFSGPTTLGISLNKAFAKQIVRDAGVPTAPFKVIQKKRDLENINLVYPLFVKPIAEGTGKGISEKSRVYNVSELEDRCFYLLETYHQPVLVEEYLPGREFTVGIVGTGESAKVIGVIEIIYRKGADIYSYHTKEHYQELLEYKRVTGELLEECSRVALSAYRALFCCDAGRVDVRIDRHGVMNFIEINPLAGLNPINSDLPILCRLNGVSYQELIQQILESAIRRHFSEGLCRSVK